MGVMMNEIWRPVIGYEGFYEVSNEGRVRSCPRDFALVNGGRYRRDGKVLAFNIKKGAHPYRRVKLSKDGVACLALVSRLVLEAFHRPARAGEQACHCNGDPSDNTLVNLRWDTPKGNLADRVTHGTAPIGERNNKPRLTECDVRAIRSHTGPLAELSAAYGVSRKYISNIRSRITWKHVN